TNVGRKQLVIHQAKAVGNLDADRGCRTQLVGEVRGDEAFTLFQAIAVGHAALGTIHAGSMNELLARIESNPMNVPRALFSNLDAVIFPMHIMRGERSARRVANITEILELDRDTGDLITNTAFRWDPEKDVFRFQGRFYLFDKIRETYGVSRETLRKELENRAAFLEWLRRRGVRDYHQVTRMIRHYSRNREVVLERIARDGEVADLLRADEDVLIGEGRAAAADDDLVLEE
ncbi:MAG: ATPase, T2SS/T4P/T4SS family, partial [Methanolinea sp.]